jgi:hypothetical protein
MDCELRGRRSRKVRERGTDGRNSPKGQGPRSKGLRAQDCLIQLEDLVTTHDGAEHGCIGLWLRGEVQYYSTVLHLAFPMGSFGLLQYDLVG